MADTRREEDVIQGRAGTKTLKRINAKGQAELNVADSEGGGRLIKCRSATSAGKARQAQPKRTLGRRRRQQDREKESRGGGGVERLKKRSRSIGKPHDEVVFGLRFPQTKRQSAGKVDGCKTKNWELQKQAARKKKKNLERKVRGRKARKRRAVAGGPSFRGSEKDKAQ